MSLAISIASSRLIALGAVFLLFSCKPNEIKFRPLKISGCIVDKATGRPLPGAKLAILAPYQKSFEKADYVSLDTVADLSGCFNMVFRGGEKVVLAARAPGLGPNLVTVDIGKDSTLVVNLGLESQKGLNYLDRHMDLTQFIIRNLSF